RLSTYGLESNGNIQFSNYWQMYGGTNVDMARWFVNALRGGRALRADPGLFAYFGVNTDTRKPVWFSLNSFGSHNFTSGQIDGGLDLGATIQARSNLDIFVGPSIYKRDDPMQYINEVADTDNQSHFVFGRIHETDV